MKTNSNTTSLLIFVLSMGMGYSLFNHFILDKPSLDSLAFFFIGFLFLLMDKKNPNEFQSSSN